MTGAVRPAAGYRADIDGLRALAVTAVVAYHAGIPWISGGFVGVDVFFVISGYLIGSIIYRDIRAGRFSFAGFYARRARRILPALFVVLGCAGIAAWLLLTPVELVRFAHGAVATIFAASNVQFWLATSYFAPAAAFNPLLMTWSLGVEEQFYVLFPILILMLTLARLPARWLAAVLVGLCAGSLALSVWGTRHVPGAAFFLLPSRAWELGVGTLLAVREVARPATAGPAHPAAANLLGGAGLLLLLAAIFGFDADTPFPGLAAAIPVAGAALVIAGRGSLTNRFLFAARPVVFVGLVSYSWYLWHWPLLSFARIAVGGSLGLGPGIVVAGAAFGLAVLSWRFVERPFRAGQRSARAVLWRSAAATAAMLALGALLAADHGWPRRFAPALAAIEAASLELQADPCLVGYGTSRPQDAPACIPRDDGRPGVALLGDSHAAALGGALRERAAAGGMAFLQLTKSSCPALAGVTRRMPNHPDHARECAAFTAAALDLVASRPWVGVVVLAGYWSAPLLEAASGSRFVPAGQAGAAVSPEESRANLQAGLEAVVAKLTAAGKRVVIATDVPFFDFDPVQHLEAAFMPARRMLRGVLGAPAAQAWAAGRDHVLNNPDAASAMIDALAARHPGVVVLDLPGRFCSGEVCRFADADGAYYDDGQHVSLAGARVALAGLRLDGAGAAR